MASNIFTRSNYRKIALVVSLYIIGLIVFFISKIFLKPKINEIRLKEDFGFSYLPSVINVLFNDGYYNISFNQNLLNVDSTTNSLGTISGLTQSDDLNSIFLVLLINRTGVLDKV